MQTHSARLPPDHQPRDRIDFSSYFSRAHHLRRLFHQGSSLWGPRPIAKLKRQAQTCKVKDETTRLVLLQVIPMPSAGRVYPSPQSLRLSTGCSSKDTCLISVLPVRHPFFASFGSPPMTPFYLSATIHALLALKNTRLSSSVRQVCLSRPRSFATTSMCVITSVWYLL
jgi:hypothetical protein